MLVEQLMVVAIVGIVGRRWQVFRMEPVPRHRSYRVPDVDLRPKSPPD